MTLYFSLGIAAILVGLTVMQAGYVGWFFRFVSQPSADDDPTANDDAEILNADPEHETSLDTYEPAVAVVLCLRGADPSLLDCLTGISLNEYPNFQLHIVVDDMHDPALAIVDEFFHPESLPPVHVIGDLNGTCSLKCAALCEAINAVPATIEVFAFLDADTVPDQNWLSDLIKPLADPNVGATTGNRWFAPIEPTLGAYVRQVWNAAAIVQMDLYNIAWGGSLAIKRNAIESADLLTKWSQSFCEDTMVSRELKQQKLRLVRVPHLICENTESATIEESYRWIVRQLLTVRLYHPRWTLVKLHGLAAIVGSIIAPLAILWFYITNDGKPFYFTAAAWVLYQGMNLILLAAIEWLNLRTIDGRNSFNPQDRTPMAVTYKFIAVVLVQYLHPWAVWTASGLHQIGWRGIDYKFRRRKKIEMVEYVPYREVEASVPVDPLEIPTRSIV